MEGNIRTPFHFSAGSRLCLLVKFIQQQRVCAVELDNISVVLERKKLIQIYEYIDLFPKAQKTEYLCYNYKRVKAA